MNENKKLIKLRCHLNYYETYSQKSRALDF